ncbi:MAG: right-handed parallel beta-helix repeat-containing protein [Wenzhouxiangellaceae bacterium]|nr:right-handed parallel beta-helix repeat-containing protein [Wenzhouxiangellaceae bacterium]
MMRRKLFGPFLILVAGSIHAGGGVLEINVACRSAGCFPGDASGAPIQITEPGSYILTSDLSVNVNTTAILIQTDDVTLDLNGFTISGPVSCTDDRPTNCNQSGIGIGIDAGGQTNVTIRNGVVRGMGSAGVVANGRGARITDLTVSENAGDGLLLSGSGALARGVSATLNGASGIVSGGAATVMDSHAISNAEFGMTGLVCSNSAMTANEFGSNCVAILPNLCDDPADCD